MLRIRKRVKQPAIKKKQKEISDAINIEKANLENLQKDEKVLIKNLEKIGENIELKNTEKEKLEKAIIKKIEKFEKIERQIKGKLVELLDTVKETEGLNKVKDKIKDKIDQESLEKKKELKDSIDVLDKGKKALEEQTDSLEAKRDGLLSEGESISKTLVEKNTKLKNLKKEIKENEVVAEAADIAAKKAIALRNDVGDLKTERKEMEQTSLLVKKEIKKARRELMSVKKERENKLTEVIKKEKEIEKREKAVEIKETGIRALEKYINERGATLQKHFDKHGMKHIRVFEK